MTEFGVYLLMFVAVLLLVGLIRFLAWLTELQETHGSLPRAGLHAIRSYASVRDYADDAPVVMSRERPSEAASAASVLKTDAGRTPYVPTPAKPKAEDYLTLCRVMRAAGIKRDDAIAAFKASGIPFNSGVWADAAPPDPAPARVTPIAGRPTDAEFPYEELTR